MGIFFVTCQHGQVDETVGNLAGGRYYNKDTVASVTLALSTNAAYVEPVHAITKWQGPSPLSGEMVIKFVIHI